MNAFLSVIVGALIVANTCIDEGAQSLRALPNNPSGVVAGCRLAKVEKDIVLSKDMQSRASTNPQALRILRAGDAATMDFRPDRLTITVDRQGRVVNVRCG